MSDVKVFCFPYAGGSAAIFNKWKSCLGINSGIELIPVELAGRGRRIQEPLYAGLQEAIEDLYQVVRDDIQNAPYAFFGHSLGGLLAYELAQKIKSLDVTQPLHLFFSGKSAPNIERNKTAKYHLMDSEEFKSKVIDLGGTPPEFFDHPELMELFLPLLRNDFKLAETNLTQRKLDPFECDISVFLGKEDYEISAEQADSWKVHTNGACVLHYFKGGHFFLNEQVAAIVGLMSDALAKHRWKKSNIQQVKMSS